jgi:glycerophosphoryl diester phosphodiesterase
LNFPAISAHRGGSEHGPGGTYEAYRTALAIGADYVEFDVRQTRDCVLVAFHEERARQGLQGRPVADLDYPRLCQLAGYEVPQVAEVMRLLAGRAGAHVDLKEAECAVAVTRLGLKVLGPTQVLVTTRDSAVLAAVKHEFPVVQAGLTIGNGRLGQALRLPSSPVRGPVLSRLRLPGAGTSDWAVIHRRLARAEVLARYQRQGIRTMVWTVNADQELARWLAAPGVDALVTDRPARAIFLRGRPPPVPALLLGVARGADGLSRHACSARGLLDRGEQSFERPSSPERRRSTT